MNEGPDQPSKLSDESSDNASADFSLREIEEHFTQLVANVEDHAIFLMDRNGHVLSWNAGARRIKGYEAREIIGQSFTKFYPQEAIDSGWPMEELRRASQSGRFEDEGWRVRKDGDLIWANVVITALRDERGQVRGFLKITRDLTERKEAEEVLRQSDERFRLMVESVQDYAIFMLDPEGRVATWNLGAQRIKGYAADEIIGQHFSCFYSSEDVANGKPQRELEIATRDGTVEDEGWRVRKDRSQFWGNVIITALVDKQGVLRGYAKITRDMTDRREVEALQFADKQKNEFLAILAHELRNPLAPIRNGMQLLKMPNMNPADVHEMAEMMDRQVDHLVRLVDDLLDISRIITGRIHLEKEPIELSSFITRAVEEVQPTIDARGHELMVALPARPIIVDGDLVRLSQVVSNLLSNAARYTEKPSRIWVLSEQSGDNVLVKVRDPGAGISPEVLPRVFNLFVQGDVSLSRSQGGLGIGLTLVKRIVEMHGGSVTATSAGLGQGSEFVVRLPVSSERAARATPGRLSRYERLKQAGRRILVVDDNVDAALSVSKLLTGWGHEVETAFNGPEALDVARTFRPEIMLLDIGLPGMSGYDVAKQLRADPKFVGLIITALTGYGQAEDKLRSREAGFNHHLVKPADPEALAAMLESSARVD